MLDALVSGLRSCLGEQLPSREQRREVADALTRFSAPDAELSALIEAPVRALAGAGTRRELALAAAQLMRLLAQRAHDRAEPEAPAQTAKSRRERAEARGRARLEREQAQALGTRSEAPLQSLERPVESLAGVGPALGLALRARGLRSLGELIWTLPLGYHDERSIVPISQLVEGERQVTEGRVVSAQFQPRGRGRRMAEVLVEQPEPDASGGRARLRLVWFRAPPGLLSRFAPGERFRLAGKVERFGSMRSITHPQTEHLAASASAKVAGIVPRYALVPGVPPRRLASVIARAVVEAVRDVPDAVPAPLRTRQGLSSVGSALAALHQPPGELDATALARWNAACTEHHARLAFEEFFLLELALHRRRAEEQGVCAEPLIAEPAQLERARRALGFELTAAQRRASEEIASDLQAPRPMRRLLQGDVGCGKTAIAMLAAAHAVSAGAQVAYMAPTEVLAEQHFRVLAPIAQALGLRAALVLGGERASHRRRTRKGLEEGTIDLAIGTHALLSEGVHFAHLRLVIVDEQHRFGVGQRLRLSDKAHGTAPHLLVMTATPIPRSLTLALHGDLATSVVDELPPGRVAPVTRAYTLHERDKALRQLERGVQSGGQAYVVCPTIEPSEEHGLRSALECFDELHARWPEFEVALLHGQLSAEQKLEAMERFASGRARILVATTIVEVGLDNPRANVMLIEQAERFGLAQLHQLRGRVGRAGQRSACLLVHEAASEEARDRIAVMCESSDGFKIAEEDLRLRGPGELFGRKQSGLPGFRFGDLQRDMQLLQQARELAAEVIERDPDLQLAEHAGARHALRALADSDRALVKEEAG